MAVKDKPHGPVSEHFMRHYYGASKPAPTPHPDSHGHWDHAQISELLYSRDWFAKQYADSKRWREDLDNKLDEVERHRDAIGRALQKRENDMMLLLNAVDAMMAHLGYHGEISTRDDRVQAVMDALEKIDPMEGK